MQGVLGRVLPEWSVAAGAVHWVTPPPEGSGPVESCCWVLSLQISYLAGR